MWHGMIVPTPCLSNWGLVVTSCESLCWITCDDLAKYLVHSSDAVWTYLTPCSADLRTEGRRRDMILILCVELEP